MKKIIIALLTILLCATALTQAGAQNATDFTIDEHGTIRKYTGTAKNVVIPSAINGITVRAIGYRALAGKQLISVVIPDSVTSIGYSAFTDNPLSSVIIPHSVNSIGNGAFAHNRLTSVTIPDSVTYIGEAAFYANKLSSVTIPRSVTRLANDAFDEDVIITRR